MSTQTQLGFVEASVQKLPTLACVGYVETVGEGKVSESGKYVVQPIGIRGVGPSRSITTNVLYRPEWLRPGFNPESLKEYGDEGDKMLAVYRRNIAVRDGVAALKGIAGSDENFNRLAAALLSLPEVTPEAVSAAIRSFFADEPAEFGYVLRQRKNKTGEQDENGKDIYELTNGYEVQEYFHATADNLKRMRQRAKRSKDGQFKVAFEEDGE